jgi:hypothetical protein
LLVNLIYTDNIDNHIIIKLLLIAIANIHMKFDVTKRGTLLLINVHGVHNFASRNQINLTLMTAFVIAAVIAGVVIVDPSQH